MGFNPEDIYSCRFQIWGTYENDLKLFFKYLTYIKLCSFITMNLLIFSLFNNNAVNIAFIMCF